MKISQTQKSKKIVATGKIVDGKVKILIGGVKILGAIESRVVLSADSPADK